MRKIEHIEDAIDEITRLGFSLEFMGGKTLTPTHGWCVYTKQNSVVVNWVYAANFDDAIFDSLDWVLANYANFDDGILL